MQSEEKFFPKYVDHNKQTKLQSVLIKFPQTTDSSPASLNRKEFIVGISGALRIVKKTVGTGTKVSFQEPFPE